MTYVEQLSVSLVRVYMQVVKLKATTAQSDVVGHGIAFVHDAPEADVATRPQLADGVRTMLHVTFVGTPSLHDAMVRSGLAMADLYVRPGVMFNVLQLLTKMNPT
jgi:hypothetical protein